jgi:dTDP-4-dehydrorhamnose reductase
MVHFSTDYVFAGDKETPYLETDSTGPLGIYGMSKLEGERLIAHEFQSLDHGHQTVSSNKYSRYFILRTSWVYGDGANFIRTILRLAAERDQLKVIADQHGVPTSADWLAKLAIEFAGSHLESGIYHAVPDGQTTWHGLAVFAIETARLAGEGIEVKSENILPIPAIEYPLPAPRPSNSRMNNSKLKKALSEMAFTDQFPQWQPQVEAYIKDFVKSSLRS